ncbi:MAG TPA: NrsF family protein [Polyangia bacterium]|nr:NrsF family protein [Polyangia bacterium]
MALSPEFKSRLLAQVREVPAPTRKETLRRQTWLFAAGLIGALAIFFIKGGLRVTARPPSLIALTSLGTAGFVGVGMWLLFTRGPTGLRRPRAVLLGAAVLSTIAFVSWRYGVSAAYGRAGVWPDRIGLRCLGLGVMTGGLMLFAALMSWRRSEPVTPVSTGAAFGAGAGLGSALLIDLWCPVAYVPHLLLGHVLPILILSVAGGVIGGRVLSLVRKR